ncbi:MAG: putative outer rane lipoprotein [Myxococcales bacterium]|nr:putative outer rane lipoprotein [Myxococcales bacterium]
MQLRIAGSHSKVVSCFALLSACGGFDSQNLARYPTSAVAASPYRGATQTYEPARGSIAEAQVAPDRPGLGTTFGEQVYAPVSFTPFVRAAASPWADVLLHYNDAAGIDAHAAYLGAQPQPLEVYAGDGSLAVALVDETGRTLPGLQAGGRTLIVGEDNQRYRIVVRNATTARFEVVASVDGLDVIDGKPADPNRRGYIVDPHDSLVIDGFRTSDANVAAFRFGRVADSYAAQTSGDRNVGVVGLAIYSEQGASWTPVEIERRDSANAFPSRGYAMPPR